MRRTELDRRCERLYEELLPRQFDYIDRWAKETPDDLAIIEYDTGDEQSWKDLALKTKAFAAKLLSMGIRKGDVVATSLPLLKEHVWLMYACYRIGAVIAPLDLRLKAGEINRSFEKARPVAYFFLGKTAVADFRPMVAEVMENHRDTCRHWVQFQKEPELVMDGAVGVTEWVADVKKVFLWSLVTGKVKRAQKAVGTRDPCLVIFTTGSTGAPKPALLCHENILTQNVALGAAFDLTGDDRMCVNLPPSHVGCTTEQLATTVWGGGTSVLLHIFDAAKTLDAIQKHRITAFGQIPALFAMQWRLADYEDYDLSSLRFALYGGQAVTRQFLEKLSTMAPKFGTGLGLTECGGFVTYTTLDGTVDDILSSIGHPVSLCPLSIREPMKEDGSAGDELPNGETGEICFTGPQVFLGYLNDEEATRRTVSTDGYCYTGDIGFYDEDGLHFAGRSKFVIKPKGYQVFPTEVEDFIEQALEGKVGLAACVGVQHEVFTEAIMAFVERAPGAELAAEELENAVKGIAAYKRPTYFEILEPGGMPLTRVAKTDYMACRRLGEEIAARLRGEGGWDA